MNDLAPQDRPREKMERAGTGALGDNELLAVLIGHGLAGASALTLANRMLGAAGGVHGLTRMSLDDLTGLPGVGRALACRALAAVELGRRTLIRRPRARPRIVTPLDAAALLIPQFGAYPVERFGVVLLDTRLRLICTRVVSIGSLDTSLGNPREVFREAVRVGAAALVAFHNHPSGDPTPSDDDLDLTRRLMAAGEVVGVQVMDHIILADTLFYSILRPRQAG
ncbi:MAG: DNA repair protein RadC [Vicinamibacterales bacterium]